MFVVPDMLTLKQVEEGCEFLGIIDKNEISKIIDNCWENHYYMEEQNEFKKSQKEKQERIKNRFIIPFGKTKKEYNEIKKETQKKIDDLKEIIRLRPDDCDYAMELRDQYIEKKKKLDFILKAPKKEVPDIAKAKQFPIDKLIEIRHGFAKRCPNHSPYKDQETPSLKYYKDKNTCYCFVCQMKFDSIDIYMRLYNVTLIEAVKKLS